MELFPSPHPLTPPHTEEDRADWLRLLRSRRVGVATFYRLMGEYGSAAAALEALPTIAKAAGVQSYAPCPEKVVHEELRLGRKTGASLVAIGEDRYPTALSQTPDAPPLLWIKGQPDLLERPLLAIVGTRNASSAGMRFTRRLAEDLGAEGFVVVSGLARGIDGIAHEAALPTGTVAVLAGGLDTIYPPEHKALQESIAAQGVLVSEQPMGMKPTARHFPMRNRIVAGMSLGTIVIEAAAKSGSLLTAGNALDYGREVMAVPGHPFDGRSAGCNLLIRDGATLIRSARDVLEAFAGTARGPAKPRKTKMPKSTPEPRMPSDHHALHSEIISRLGSAPIEEDQLIRDLGLSASVVSSELVTLELDGRISRRPGGLLSLS